MSLLAFPIERRPERAKSISPPPLSCASSLQLVHPMHYSHSLQLQVAAHCAIAHIREFFVSELEWFIVSLYRLALPCARSPRNSQSEVCEFKGYFYLLPSPILTLLPTPYHTAYSSSFHLRCNRALRSRASNSFCTTLLDGTIWPQHRKTRARPPLELTAHFECTQISRCSKFAFPQISKSRSHTTRLPPPAHPGEPPQNRQNAQRHRHHPPAVRHPLPKMSQRRESHPFYPASFPSPPVLPMPQICATSLNPQPPLFLPSPLPHLFPLATPTAPHLPPSQTSKPLLTHRCRSTGTK